MDAAWHSHPMFGNPRDQTWANGRTSELEPGQVRAGFAQSPPAARQHRKKRCSKPTDGWPS
ncbi:MAG: hypothetical protein ACPG77_04855 [Nannocystaceae bacterium]